MPTMSSRPSSSHTSDPSVVLSGEKTKSARSYVPTASTKIVDWEVDDEGNPRNWKNRRRWTVTVIVSLFTFISPVASSISSPALPQISQALGIHPGSVLQDMVLSIFVLAYVFGPLIWGPLSELFGRFPILQISNFWFLLFNSLCAISKTPTQMLVFRFLAGFGGAAPQSIGGAIVGDLWSPDERGMAMSIYSLAPLCGPAVGPLIGGWIAQRTQWQWVFWSVTIADALLQVAALCCLRETYAPQILKKRALAKRKETHDENIRSVFECSNQTPWNVISRGMVRPLFFLVTEPIIFILALYMAVLYGVLYLSLTTFVRLFVNVYGESVGISGLHYLTIILGSTVGGQVGARALNVIYRRMKALNGGVGTPEMRLPLLMVSSTALPIGLLVYGWTANAKTFWLLPDLGVFIYFVGIGGNWTCIQTYIVDSYGTRAASALASVVSFRAFAGFGFPLFSDKIFDANSLGYGWGTSILALICLVLGCPAPFVFYRYGPKLRSRSNATLVET